MQAVEQGIKPGQETAKDALKQAKEQIPEPQAAKDQVRSMAEDAVKPAAQTVKDNARPIAEKIESQGIRPAQEAAEALPDKVKVRTLLSSHSKATRAATATAAALHAMRCG